jgi:hypothetical protein
MGHLGPCIGAPIGLAASGIVSAPPTRRAITLDDHSSLAAVADPQRSPETAAGVR